MAATATVGVVGLAWASYAGFSENSSTSPSRPAEHTSPSESFADTRVSPAELSRELAPTASIPIAPAASSVGITPRPSPEIAATPKKCTETTPAYEAELFHRDRAALSREPSTALALARQHAGCFARSELAEEREALRIEALYRLGRSAEAHRARELFESRFPGSPYRRRLRTLIE